MNKKNLLLGGILAILIIGAYIYKGPFNDWQNNQNKPDNFFSSIKTDEITQIKLVQRGETIVLEKNGDRWKIADTKDFYVKEDKMTAVFKALNDAVKSDVEIVSENKDKKIDFQTDESGILVSLARGETEIANFIIGKVGSDFTSTYVSRLDDNKTYLLKASLNSALGHKNWYDKTIFSTDAEKINKIRFQYPNREFIIEKQDEDWVGVSPYRFSVDSDKAEKIVSLMSNLMATEIPTQNFAGTGLEKNLIIIEASGEEIKNTLMIGDIKTIDDENSSEPLYYVKRADSDNIYLITKDQRDELDRQIWDLK